MKKIVVPIYSTTKTDTAFKYASDINRVLNGEVVFFNTPNGERQTNHSDMYEKSTNFIAPVIQNEDEFVSHKKTDDIDFARELFKDKLNLIILGTREETDAFAKTNFETYVTGIIQDRHCALLAVPEEYDYRPLKKIGYASDLNNLNDELTGVIKFARLFNASIEVFHVSPVFPDLGSAETMDVASSIETIRQRFNYMDINYSVEKTNSTNQIVKGVDDYSHYNTLDLLILFHDNKKGMNAFSSPSNSKNIAKRITIPLLLFAKT